MKKFIYYPNKVLSKISNSHNISTFSVKSFVEEFQAHPGAKPHLFSWLNQQNKINRLQYDLFQRNFATRQVLTVPMLSYLTAMVSLSNDFASIKNIGMLVMEETGSEKKEFNPHSGLLQNSLFTIGTKVFNLEKPDISKNVIALKALTEAKEINIASSALRCSEKKLIEASVAKGVLPEEWRRTSTSMIIEEAINFLNKEKILPEVRLYAENVFKLLKSNSLPEVTGAVTVLELFGEDMMAAYEKLAVGLKHYLTHQDYEKYVEPYFIVHQDGDQSLDIAHRERLYDIFRNTVKTVADWRNAHKGGSNQASHHYNVFKALYQVMDTTTKIDERSVSLEKPSLEKRSIDKPINITKKIIAEKDASFDEPSKYFKNNYEKELENSSLRNHSLS